MKRLLTVYVCVLLIHIQVMTGVQERREEQSVTGKEKQNVIVVNFLLQIAQ